MGEKLALATFAVFLWAWAGSMAVAAEPRYDLLLTGGHVIDPKNGLSAVRDVAIEGGRSPHAVKGTTRAFGRD